MKNKYANDDVELPGKMKFTIYHADHGISPVQLDYIKTYIEESGINGFNIFDIKLPSELGEVPCGLFGPVMGDAPVSRDMVTMTARGDRGWKDPIVDWALRPVDNVQAIGIVDRDKMEATMFTIYGGPLAPQNPEDPSNPDPASAAKFWSEHALSGRPSVLEDPDLDNDNGDEAEAYDEY